MITIFGEKIVVFLKNQCYDPLFAEFSSVLRQKRQFFRRFLGAKIFLKIIKSSPVRKVQGS
jgi:hypothetical protein